MVIKLKEEQLKLLNMLIEGDAAPDFEDGDIKEFGNPSEVSTTATITDDEGNPKYGKMNDTDKLGDFLTKQNWWGRVNSRL